MAAAAEAIQSLETLIQHRAFVRDLARRLVREGSDIDDVEQETWLAALKRPPREGGRAWLGGVVRNATRQLARGESRRKGREERVRRAEAGVDSTRVVARAELAHLVVERVLALNEPGRTTVLLRYFEGLAPRQIAQRLGVPTETVRTRLKRSLEELRHGLRDERGPEWRNALLPLAIAPVAISGGFKIAVAACVLGIASLGASALGLFSSSSPEEALTDSAGSGRDTAHLEVPADGGDPAETGVPPAIDVRPLEVGAADSGEVASPTLESPKASPPIGAPAGVSSAKLELTARIEPFRLVSGEPMTLIARFRNEGTSACELFVPSHAGLVPFPVWRLESADGSSTFRPARPVFQTMVMRGLQGTIVRLEPGESHEVRSKPSMFQRVGKDGGNPWTDPKLELPEGRYRVLLSHSQDRAVVPWVRADGEEEWRPRPDLWTGAVKGEPVFIDVEAPDRIIASLSFDKSAARDGALPLIIALEGGRTRAYQGRGHWELRTISKAEGNHVVALPKETLALAAKARYRKTVDLSKLVWKPISRHGLRPKFEGALREIWTTRFARLGARWVPEDPEEKPDPRMNSGCSVDLGELADGEKHGLRLEVELLERGGAWPTLKLLLHNRGETTLRVPREMSWPRNLQLRMLRKPKKGSGETVRPGRFPPIVHPDRVSVSVPIRHEAEHAAPLTGDDFTTLVPGGSLGRSFDLQGKVNAPLQPGLYELRIFWRNGEDGRRLGFEGEGRAFLGTVRHETLKFRVP